MNCLMKTRYILIITCVITAISCSKPSTVAPPQKSISYPDSIYYGKNILSLPDSTFLDDTKNYDLGASLEKDANLIIVISNLSSDTLQNYPIWYYNNNIGLSAQEYNSSNNTQRFFSTQSGKIDLQIQFLTFGNPGTGKCKIAFYENSDTITRTKYLKW